MVVVCECRSLMVFNERYLRVRAVGWVRECWLGGCVSEQEGVVFEAVCLGEGVAVDLHDCHL